MRIILVGWLVLVVWVAALGFHGKQKGGVHQQPEMLPLFEPQLSKDW